MNTGDLNSAAVPSQHPSLTEAEVGAVVYRTTQRIRRDDLVTYAYASGDHNPIHQDETFATGVGLPGVIAHGMLTFSLVASAVEDLAGGAQQVQALQTRFAAPVVVPVGEEGVEVAIELTLTSRDEDARTAVLDAAVTVAEAKVLNRTRATLSLN